MNLKKIFKSIRLHEIILFAAIAIYIIYFTTASFLRYEHFYTGRFDLGNMTQTVWNSANGRIFQVSDSNPKEIISRLAAHADFMLILLAPLFYVWSDPRMLLLVLTISLAVGAFFVYKISEILLKNKTLSLIIAVSYLLYPALQYNNLYDFHAVSLATTFLLGAFYFLLIKKYLPMTIFLILAGITKEQVWAVTGLFGLYIFVFKKSKLAKKLGIAIFLLSFFIFYYLIWHAIPDKIGGNHFALSYYSEFGNSPSEVVKNIIFSPQKIISEIFQEDRVNFLKQLFMPLGFLSLLSPLYLIFTLPDLGINLLSNNPQLHQIYYQYTPVITPFIFIAAVYGIKTLFKIFPKIPIHFYSLYLIIMMLYSAYTIGPMPFSQYPNTDMITNPLKNKSVIDKLISTIPEKYSVAASNELGSHLSHRQKIFVVPYALETADFVLFFARDSFDKPPFSLQKEMIDKLRESKNYIKILEKENFIVFINKRIESEYLQTVDIKDSIL